MPLLVALNLTESINILLCGLSIHFLEILMPRLNAKGATLEVETPQTAYLEPMLFNFIPLAFRTAFKRFSTTSAAKYIFSCTVNVAEISASELTAATLFIVKPSKFSK